ncbi:MAG: CRISPR-associated endonuclease Cas2 [Myxococcota bacterium]
MTRHAFIVSYDITDDRRRREVYDICRGFGERVQYSVFRCHLDETERIELQVEIEGAINHLDDQVLFIDIGPVEGRAKHCVRAIGRGHDPPDDGPVFL